MGRRHSAKTRQLMSRIATGKGNPFYGRHHKSETKKKMSRRMRGKSNPMHGKHHTQETIRTLRAAALKRMGA